MESVIQTNKAMITKSIAASGVGDSDIIDLNELGSTGSFSVQYEITGSGTCKIEWLQTSDGTSKQNATNFVLPSGGYEVANSLTATTGTGSDGKDLLQLSTIPSSYLKLRVTETGGANAVVVTLIISTN